MNKSIIELLSHIQDRIDRIKAKEKIFALSSCKTAEEGYLAALIDCKREIIKSLCESYQEDQCLAIGISAANIKAAKILDKQFEVGEQIQHESA